MEIKTIVHYAALAYFIYIFGYAGLFKVIRKKSMMASMESLGYNTFWTLVIGWAEVLGVTGLIAGLFLPHIKSISVLFLLPFAIGAFTSHMAHREFSHYRHSLTVCILPFFILFTDETFRLVL